eukprot:TRINITY_DN998_c0_g1_i4.p1 TRINITY_DN998_c0_g1~~TRINITY_DN998_c0_g1_i4.p1  ORF type:complete len:137 (+),score=29.88 TRINITY_DN998_c0_g1_i4:80-490(+)
MGNSESIFGSYAKWDPEDTTLSLSLASSVPESEEYVEPEAQVTVTSEEVEGEDNRGLKRSRSRSVSPEPTKKFKADEDTTAVSSSGPEVTGDSPIDFDLNSEPQNVTPAKGTYGSMAPRSTPIGAKQAVKKTLDYL